MPRPSLTEEMESLYDEDGTSRMQSEIFEFGNRMSYYGRLAERYPRKTRTPEQKAEISKALGEAYSSPVFTRLTALEIELEGYRKAIIPDSEPRISSSSGMALPCTSEYVNAQSGYDGETGG